MLKTYATRHGRLAHFMSDTTIRQSLECYGEWGEAEIYLLSHWLREGDTVLDIGANIGTHSLAFARLVGPKGHVIALEAQHKVFQILGMNMMVNGAFHVDCLNVLAASALETRFIPTIGMHEPVNFGAASFASAKMSGGRSLPVSSITIDSLRLAECAVMKVDVEGMEIQIFEGALETIMRCQPIIYFEQTGATNFDRIWSLFRRLEYGLVWHVSNPFNANNYHHNTHNIFGGTCEINVVAVPSGRRDIMDALGADAQVITQPVYNPVLPENSLAGWTLPVDAYGDLPFYATDNTQDPILGKLEADHLQLRNAYTTLTLQFQDLAEDRRKAQTIMEVQHARLTELQAL